MSHAGAALFHVLDDGDGEITCEAREKFLRQVFLGVPLSR